MSASLIPAIALVCALPCLAFADDAPRVVLSGEVGNAATACAARLRFAPFDSAAWLRADLTGEKASEFDKAGWGHVLFRPFKNYSGDISGRFIEIMAMDSHGDMAAHPAFKSLLEAAWKEQRPDGYFCASGVIDWQQPLDHPKKGEDALGSRMLPALWGNARLLCGLVEVMRGFPKDEATAAAARRLGDFYVSMMPSFNDPERMAEYNAGGTYAAGYMTCWFPAMEGLVKLSPLTGDKKYLDAAVKMAAFFQRFDCLPVDHAHGMLCSYVSLLLLHEATGDTDYLTRVEKRWDELVQCGYINPAGGVLEKCHVRFARDEGCAIVDWLRLNLALGRVTGKARYWAMAERTLHNHLLQNQTSKGGFGHRRMICDDKGAYGFGHEIEESTWCCTFHGELAFIQLRKHLLSRADGILTCNFALDFSAQDAAGTTTSILRPGIAPGEVLRQRVSLAGQPGTIVRVRLPHWANAVNAVDATGAPIPLKTDGNLAWIFLSDEKAGVPGELTPESCDWLESELAKHKGKNIIICSHQGVKGTTIKTDKPDRHIHPADRIAALIEKSDIALWMSGHEHHAPYTAKHIAKVAETTYINVASMSHAYKTGSSQSCLLEFQPGAKHIIARRREHDTQKFMPEFEVTIPLRHPIKLGSLG